jgi:hypothetical protein
MIYWFSLSIFPQTPGVTPYIGGSQMWIKIQQNYNHYEVGYPGIECFFVEPYSWFH